ncbi:hypothetical protein M7I_2912 [Glarea lozoyensis 74030]|uniref:NmrA-like domain-containing protein n=1 Tax=Glarea lozoyensis (strain ATCC 74030 / MF5533) TaxID=1104152 RepID=H0EK24_GLAL7|nr:hypothetical protein M7I_2912 [Glarea lozoyensis 74030]
MLIPQAEIILIRPTTFTSPSPLKSHQLTSLSSLGVTFLPADILTLTPKDLTTLFTPYTLIISALGFASPSSALQTKITRAVLAAKVPRYIPWQFGVDYDIIGRGSGQPVWDEQLDALEEKLGVEVGRVLWDVEFLERELRDDPDDNMKRYRVAFAKGRGVSWDKERSFNVEKGLEVVDVEDFVERNMERIRQGEELSEKWK